MEINVCKKKSEIGLVANAYLSSRVKARVLRPAGLHGKTLSLEEKNHLCQVTFGLTVCFPNSSVS